MERVQVLAPIVLPLLVGIVSIMLMRPLGLSPIVGYLVAGLAIGPHGFILIPDSDTTHLLAMSLPGSAAGFLLHHREHVARLAGGAGRLGCNSSRPDRPHRHQGVAGRPGRSRLRLVDTGSLQLGFLITQGSEFVFVIAAMPAVRDALGESLVGVVITGVAASPALAATLAAFGNRLARPLRRRSAAATPAAEKLPRAPTKPAGVFGLDEARRCVVDALVANHVAYDAVGMDYDRFLAASADGYPAAFGDVADVRLMETLAMAERSAVVVTIIRYELSQALTPIMQDRYPNLIRFIAKRRVQQKRDRLTTHGGWHRKPRSRDNRTRRIHRRPIEYWAWPATGRESSDTATVDNVGAHGSVGRCRRMC